MGSFSGTKATNPPPLPPIKKLLNLHESKFKRLLTILGKYNCLLSSHHSVPHCKRSSDHESNNIQRNRNVQLLKTKARQITHFTI